MEPANGLLLQKTVPADPFQIQMEHFFRLAFVPLDGIAAPRWAYFTYWDYDRKRRFSRLVYSSGLRISDGRSSFPRKIANGAGIIGSLAERFSCGGKEIQPHISQDYGNDALLRSRDAVRSLGLVSGVAVPLSLAGYFSGILMIHFKYKIADVPVDGSRMIMDAAQRLSILMRLAQDHYTRILVSNVSNTFASPRVRPEKVADDQALDLTPKRTQVETVQVLDELARCLKSSGVAIEFADSIARYGRSSQLPLRSIKSSNLEATWSYAHEEPVIKLTLNQWSENSGQSIGSLTIYKKSNGLGYSTCDVLLAREVTRQLSIHLSTLRAIQDLEATALYRLRLLEVCTEISARLLRQREAETILSELKDGILSEFPIAEATFVEPDLEDTGLGKMTPGKPEPVFDPPGYAELPIFYRRMFSTLVLASVGESSLNPDEKFVLRVLADVAGLAIWSGELLAVVERTASEEARANLARDIVHALHQDVPALITRLELMERLLDKIENDASRKKKVLSHTQDLRKRLDLFADNIRTQANVLSRYKWVRVGAADEVSTQADVPVDLVEVRENLVRAMQSRARAREVVIHEPKSERVVITANQGDIYLIFLNLLDNAVKFSKKGGEVYYHVDKASSGAVTVKIRDFGVGIRSEHRPRIWDPGFSMIAPGKESNTSGIGLHSVKEAVTRIAGATIEVSSSPGQYTEFAVEFPREIVL